jgi:hypothetical protein
MMLGQVGQGGAGWRSRAERGEVVTINAVSVANRLAHPAEILPAKRTLLPVQAAMGLVYLGDLLAQTFQDSLAAQKPAMPRFDPLRAGRIRHPGVARLK